MKFSDFAQQAWAIADRYACLFFLPCYDPKQVDGAFYCLYRFPTDPTFIRSEGAKTATEALQHLEVTLANAYQYNQLTSAN